MKKLRIFLKKISVLVTKGDFKKFLLIFFGILLSGILEMVGISSIAPFMAVVTSPEIVNENEKLEWLYKITGAQSHKEFIVMLGFGVIFTLLVSNSYQAFMTWVITNFSRTHTYKMSVRLLRQYLFKPYSFFLGRNTSEMGKNVISEVTRGVNGVLMPILNIFSKTIIALSIFILIILIEPYAALVAMVIFGGVYLLLYFLVRKILHRIGTQTTDAATARFKIANESITGIKEVKLRGSENIFISLFDFHSEVYAKNYAIRSIISSIPRYFIEVIAFGGIVAIIIFMLLSGKNETEVITLTSVYAMAGYRLLPAIQGIYSSFTNLRFNLPILDILSEDLKEENSETEIINNNEDINFHNKINIKELSFSYDGIVDILSNINLSIDRNTTVGFVGTTGSGKTTLIDVLLGLLSPNKGNVFIDSVKLNKNNIRMWQQKIGYVPQSIFIMDDSIENNIAFGVSSEKINRANVIKAAKIANLHNFVSSLECGYDTSVGDRGLRLSGGQLQRIGIARAVYHNPEVLILDEATSSLDGTTENFIMESIHRISHQKTILIIAHRLTTLKSCDIIHILDNGKIVESGNYDYLIKNSRVFKKMSNIK